MKKLLFFFYALIIGLTTTVSGQTPEPKPKTTLLDLNTTLSSFDGHLWELYKQEEEPAFATWVGIPQKEIKKRKIRKITFNGEGNEIFRPKEVGDYGGHNNLYIREDRVKVRVDTLPPKPQKQYAFSYEFDPKGKLLKADLPATGKGESTHVRRWYYPDGKLKESRYISYNFDRNRNDTLVRYYTGFVLVYDKDGRKSEMIEYGRRIESWYHGSTDLPKKKAGYYFETRKWHDQTKFGYGPKGQLMATRTYQLPDSGQTGPKALKEAAYYFYDKSGKLQRKLAITEMRRKETRNQMIGGFMREMLYAYKGNHLHRVIKNEFSFSSAVPDTLLAAKGKIGPDSSNVGTQYYISVGSEDNPGPHPYFKVFETPDTVYYLKPGETRSHYRNYYFRQDKEGRLDMAYNWEAGAQKRYFGNKLLEQRTDNGTDGYECRFVWLNSNKQPKREIWIDRYNSGVEGDWHYCEDYPNEDCNTLEDLVMHKRISVIDQRYQYRKDGLPEKITFRKSLNREALRKVGEKNPRSHWAELLLKPCRPCEPCENVKKLVKEEPEWPFRNSSLNIFTNFDYQYW